MATNEPETCFYCGILLSKDGTQYDHFPIPENAGGTGVVPCCRGCHDMKDRFDLGDWSTDWLSKVICDFPNLNRETRLFLATIMRLHFEHQDRYVHKSLVNRPEEMMKLHKLDSGWRELRTNLESEIKRLQDIVDSMASMNG